MNIEKTMVPMEDGVRLFTYVFLPEGPGPFCTVFVRTPYDLAPAPEVTAQRAREVEGFINAGFAVVLQHCRGRGGSEGEFVPFRGEREDGLTTLAWIQQQGWYGNGVYLWGVSYHAFAHMAYLAQAPDCVKGAALCVMCPDGSKAFFKNGAYKADLAPIWFMEMYKHEDLVHESSEETYRREFFKYPMSEFAQRAYGHPVPAFDDFLKLEEDPMACPGGFSQARGAMRGCRVPVLLQGGWGEMFLGGMADMWGELPGDVREKSAFLVGPWAHTLAVEPAWAYNFENAQLPGDPVVEWFLHLRDGTMPAMSAPGAVRYYAVGEGEWKCAPDFPRGENAARLYLSGDRRLVHRAPEPGEIAYRFDPLDPPSFPGGPDAFCHPPMGFAPQPPPDFRPDVISFLTQPLERALPIEGRVRAKLSAMSDCDDTMFVLRLHCVEENGTATVMQEMPCTLASYAPGTWKDIELTFDPMAWTLRPGERLRLDISSANAASYRVHSNFTGDWRTVHQTRPAINRVRFPESMLEMPIS